MSLFERTAVDWLQALNAGEVTSVELTQRCLDRIEALDERVGAFLSRRGEAALARAEQIDRRRAAKEPVGPLGGLPLAVKDVVCTKGEPTTCGSRILEQFKPPYNATLIERLEAADAVLVGKTNMDEFAMGSSNENSAFHAARNPWNLERVPGGSSGGSAACVAAGMTPLAIGSDTGGSIRQPASYCGVVGLKPTYGRVSRYGLVAFASSLDQLGPLARSAEDAALLLEAIAGHDPRDSTSAPQPVDDYRAGLAEPLKNLRLGVVREYFGEGLDAEVRQAVEEAIAVFRTLGATTVDVSLPHSKYGIATYYIIAPSEASSNLARYDGVHYGYRTDESQLRAELDAERRELEQRDPDAAGKLDSLLVRMYRRTRAEGFGPEVQRRVMLGAYALSEGYYDKYYLKALQVRRLIRNDFDAVLQQCDVLIGPTTPTTAYRIGEKADDPLSMYLGDLYTVSANLAGLPAVSIPCGLSSDGLPIGLQLHGSAFAERRLLQAAHQFQQATDWHSRTPEIA